MQNSCCCFSRPPILASEIHPKNMFFMTPSWTLFFNDYMLILYENCRFLYPFKIKWALKWNPKSTKRYQKGPQKHRTSPFGGSWNRPFPESIRIEVLKIVYRFMIDLGSQFCKFVKCVDGFAVVLGTLFKHNLANSFS